MSAAASPSFLQNERYKRAAHGAASFTIAAVTLLALLMIGGMQIQPLMATYAMLKERAQSADALNMRLERQQAALAENLRRINAPSFVDAETFAAPQIITLLNTEADALVAAMESHGLVLSSRSAPAENKFSPALSTYAVALRFSASSEAAAAAIVNDLASDMHIVRIRMNEIPGDTALTVDIDLQRIGASTETDERADG